MPDAFETRLTRLEALLLPDEAGKQPTLPLDRIPLTRLASWLENSTIPPATQAVAGHSVKASEIGTLPSASRYHPAGYAMATGAWTTFLLEGKEWDTDGMIDPAAAKYGRIYCKTRGLYLVTGHTYMSSGAAGERHMGISKNAVNAQPLHATQGEVASVVFGPSLAVADIIPLLPGDYVVLTYYQNGGAGLTTFTTTRLKAHWLGDWASDTQV